MDKIKKLFEKHREIIVYVIFGALTTLVNWAVYTVFVELFHVDITVSNAVAWVAGVLFAFVTNKIWVFRSKSKQISTVLREFFSFVSARIVTGIIEIFLPKLLINIGIDRTVFGIDGSVAKLIVSVIVIVLNYVFSKLIVFRKKKEQ